MTCYRMAVAIVALAMVGMALWNPRAARGAEADVWVVSTRRLPATCTVPLAPSLDVQRYVEAGCGQGCQGGRWEAADLPSLLAGDEPLVIFIHGNRYEAREARQQGLQLARRCHAACNPAGSIRTVIFSWPSEQQGILGKDGRAKYERAYSEGRYMAWLLGQLDPHRPVGIVGYSFGALITLEALNDLVAAEEAGRADLQPWRHRPAQTNLMFIAPAVRCDAFSPCGPYRRTLDCVDRVSLIINSRDRALRFFPVVDSASGMEALGHAGMPRRWLPEHVEFTAVNAEEIIGKRHGLPLYLASPSLTRRLCSSAICDLE
jgi:esterase/lipase superfamily enzyme